MHKTIPREKLTFFSRCILKQKIYKKGEEK